MKKRNVLIIFGIIVLISLIGYFVIASWISNFSLVNGLPDMGGTTGMASPVVFQIGSQWHLISGQEVGRYQGFTWNGVKWINNATINASLPDSGVYSKIDVWKWGSRWVSLLGSEGGKCWGYQWNGTNWIKNATINASLPDIGTFSVPDVFNTSTTKRHLLIGERNGNFKGFTWNGSDWVKNATINASLPDVGDFATGDVFYFNYKLHLLAGKMSGGLYGFTWNGSNWVNNDTINESLPSGYIYKDPSVFTMGVTQHLIFGEGTGTFAAYSWDYNPKITINSPLNQTYNTTTINFNITSIDDLDTSNCVYSFDKGVKNYSLTRGNLYRTYWNTTTEYPTGITTDGNYIWVSDTDKYIYKYYMNGTYTGISWNASIKLNDVPIGITNNGTYFWILLDTNGNDEVYKFYMNGTFISNFTLTNFAFGGITTYGGYLWFTTSDRMVQKYYTNGTYIEEWYLFGLVTGQFPRGITTDGTYIWIVESSGAEAYQYYINGTYTGVHWNLYGPTAQGTYSITPLGITQNATNFWVVHQPAAHIGSGVFLYNYPSSVQDTWTSTNSSMTSGSKNVTFYCNDTVDQFNSKESIIFYMSVPGVPNITLKSPSPNQYINHKSNVYFNFTAIHVDPLDTCQLWTNTTGTWERNYTWVYPTSGVMNFTTLNVSEGRYKYNVWCNESFGYSGFNSTNYTFEIDTTIPYTRILSPSNGSIIRGAIIEFNHTLTELHPSVCSYTVKNSTGSIEINNVTTSCSNGNVTFAVSRYGTYSINFTVWDLASNINSSTIYLTTSQSSSGGGGGSTIITIPGENITINRSFCGDLICQFEGNDFGVKEDYWNCQSDCPGAIGENLDKLIYFITKYCFDKDPETLCFWTQGFSVSVQERIKAEEEKNKTICGDNICKANENPFNCEEDCGKFSTDMFFNSCKDKDDSTPCFWKMNLAIYIGLGIVGVFVIIWLIKNKKKWSK